MHMQTIWVLKLSLLLLLHLDLRRGRCHGWGLHKFIDCELVAWLKAMEIVVDYLGPSGLASVSSIRRCERIFGRVPGVLHILSYPKSCCDWQNSCKYNLFFLPCGACVHHPNTCGSSTYSFVSKSVTCGIFSRVIWKGRQRPILKPVFLFLPFARAILPILGLQTTNFSAVNRWSLHDVDQLRGPFCSSRTSKDGLLGKVGTDYHPSLRISRSYPSIASLEDWCVTLSWVSLNKSWGHYL